jgi:hypothetical protein
MQIGSSSVFAIAVISLWAQAACAEEAEGLWERAQVNISRIADQGDWDLYLSGYAYHSRSTYSQDRIKRLNEKAWGGGFGKSLRNSSGNDESLYVIVIRDSLYKPQWAAGYSYEWIFPLGGSGMEVGAGVTALIMRRSDWANGVPFPALLPVASIGTRKARLEATFVPRLSTSKGKGNIILLVGKFTFG